MSAFRPRIRYVTKATKDGGQRLEARVKGPWAWGRWSEVSQRDVLVGVAEKDKNGEWRRFWIRPIWSTLKPGLRRELLWRIA